ncbi:hypothetical protein FXO38_29907 [Capsicum annuum]|nr:hypothetical protein FXO38_29907 [Capsicum annuum]
MEILYFIHTFIYSQLTASPVPFSDFKMVEDGKYEFFPYSKVSFSRLMASLRQEFSMKKQFYRLSGIPQEFEKLDLPRTSFASDHLGTSLMPSSTENPGSRSYKVNLPQVKPAKWARLIQPNPAQPDPLSKPDVDRKCTGDFIADSIVKVAEFYEINSNNDSEQVQPDLWMTMGDKNEYIEKLYNHNADLVDLAVPTNITPTVAPHPPKEPSSSKRAAHSGFPDSFYDLPCWNSVDERAYT